MVGERVGPTSPYSYFEERIANFERRFATDRIFRKEFRRRTVVLWQSKPQRELVLELRPLNSQLENAVEVDRNGVLYLFRWQQTGRIAPGYELLGQKAKRGHDYTQPLKTRISERLTVSDYPIGIEAVLRTCETIVAKETTEAGRLDQIEGRADEIGLLLPRITEIGEDERGEIVQKYLALLDELGFFRARNPHKVRIRQMFERGVVEKNVLVDLTRRYSIKRSVIIRREAVRAILAGYSLIQDQLHVERNRVRSYFAEVRGFLDGLLALPIFSDPNTASQHIEKVDEILSLLSVNLLRVAWFNPYSWGANTAVVWLGHPAITAKFQPGTVARDLQIRRNKVEPDNPWGEDTVYKALDRRDFATARGILTDCRDRIFKKVLEVHEPYEAVKPSPARRKRLEEEGKWDLSMQK